jgi:glycerol-3-phosphate cytidylyltransferase
MGIVAKMITGVTFGAFDLLHTGHVMFLKEAARQCDLLTVGLHLDPSVERPEKSKPVQSIFERYTQLEELRSVSTVMPYETEKDLDYILRNYRYDKRFLGSDYRQAFDERKVGSQNTCMLIRTEIVFITRFHNYSSTELRERIKNG